MLSGSRSAIASALVLLVLASCSGSSDTTPKAQRVAIPHMKRFPGAPFDKAAWLKLWRETPGTPHRRCVDVGSRTDVRSGDFVVGNFVSFVRYWDGTEEQSKLYYIPLYPSPPAPLVVTATRLGAEPPLVVTLQFGPPYSWTLKGAPFYVTGTVLRERGRWRLEPVAGQNRGCFEFQL
jgi:hypothetical protein